jgi:protease-4
MVDVAASGGYYVAYTANKILACPMTVTGSIGSISAKFNMSGFDEKLGITHDVVTKGPMGLIWSETRDFTKEEWERFQQNHWDGFNMWLRDVAEKRGMTFEEAQKLAYGRTWTGTQATENGLIDGTGGLDEAIAMAKELAGIPADEKVTIVHYPKQRGFMEQILSGGGLATAANWVIYNFIQDKVVETWNLLSGSDHTALMEGMVLE